MTAMTPAREFILSRFKQKNAKKKGGVSSAVIFSERSRPSGIKLEELERELIALKKEGVLSYTGGNVGLWWKRR